MHVVVLVVNELRREGTSVRCKRAGMQRRWQHDGEQCSAAAPRAELRCLVVRADGQYAATPRQVVKKKSGT